MTPQAGDILAIRGHGWLSDGIARAEYPYYEPLVSATHVGIFISCEAQIGTFVSHDMVIEALNRVQTRLLPDSISDTQKAYCLHDKSLTDLQRSAIVSKALSFSTDDYGYLDLFAQYLDATFHTTWWTDRLAVYLSHRPICSYVVAAAYAVVQLNFGVSDASCRPSDIIGFALKHPEIYEIEVLKNG